MPGVRMCVKSTPTLAYTRRRISEHRHNKSMTRAQSHMNTILRLAVGLCVQTCINSGSTTTHSLTHTTHKIRNAPVFSVFLHLGTQLLHSLMEYCFPLLVCFVSFS